MRFGVAKEIITPVEPTRLVCSGPLDEIYKGVHDDIFVRCLVLDDGKSKSVFLSYDLVFYDHSLNDRIAAYANEKYDIEKDAVVIAHTHAHMTPSVRGYCPGAFHYDYEEFLVERSKNVLDRAIAILYEGEVEYGTFDGDFNISRRGVRDGVRTNAPDLDYKCDKEFFVMYIRDMAGRIRFIMTNYACHPVNHPAIGVVCSDFPGRMVQHLEMKYYGAMGMFFQSSGGDVRPKPTATAEVLAGILPWQRLSFEKLDAFSKEMADSVIDFIESGKAKKADVSIASDGFEIELPIDVQPLSVFEKMLEERKAFGYCAEKQNAEDVVNGGYNKLTDSMFLRCQTIKISDDLYITAIGGEPCYRVKCAVREAFADKDFCFIGYTDGCAYIVDDVVIDEGGYEPNSFLEYGLKGPFKKGLNKKYSDGFKASRKRIENK